MIGQLPEHQSIQDIKKEVQKRSKGKNIVSLLSCTKKKLQKKAPARELYAPSYLFRGTYKIAKNITPYVFILSAKHGLLPEDQVIQPYDKTLTNLKKKERKEWATKVLEQIQQEINVKETYILIFAGKAYYEDLITKLPQGDLFFPKNMGIGKRIKYLSIILNTIDKLTLD